MKPFAKYLTNLPKTPLTEAVQSLYEASERVEPGTAWNDVERIHVYHAADPSMDIDIKLDSLWATRQKNSATRQDVIDRFIEDAEDFNKWLATSEDYGAFITTASIKFKGDPNEVSVKIPCPGDDQIDHAQSVKPKVSQGAAPCNNSLDHEDFDDGIHYSEEDPDPFQDA